MMKWFKGKKKKKNKTSVPAEGEVPSSEEAPAEEEPSPARQSMEAMGVQEEAGTQENAHASREEPHEDGISQGAQPEEEPEEEIISLDDPLEEEEDQDDASQKGEEPEQKRRFFRRLRERMHKTRENFTSRVDRLVLGKKTIDMDLLDDLEEVLITSDLGVRTTQTLLQRVTDKIKRKELKEPEKLREQLRQEIQAILNVPSPPLDLSAQHPFVIMVVGVNGVGKTTTIGKLAHQFKAEGRKVMLAACDTFRAAAVEQLVLWGERAHVPVIRQKSGSDPSAVAFDAMDAAVSRHMDVLLLDTAGRMHTKVNLMEELKKVHRTLQRKMEWAPHETWLVLDATTGQNALSQARLFKEAIGVTGLILTKLDGTAKGGIAVAICDELQIPVRYIGIGESLEDLRPFDSEEFARAIF